MVLQKAQTTHNLKNQIVSKIFNYWDYLISIRTNLKAKVMRLIIALRALLELHRYPEGAYPGVWESETGTAS